MSDLFERNICRNKVSIGGLNPVVQFWLFMMHTTKFIVSFLKRCFDPMLNFLDLFYIHFRSFQAKIQILQQNNVKNVHPVSGAGI